MKPWKRILWAAAALLCLLLALVLWQRDRVQVANLTPQQAALRWETEEKTYAMASVFLEEKHALPQDGLIEVYMNVEKVLTAGGVPSEEYPWLYAASVITDGVLVYEGNTAPVELTAVAGDFFDIHPMEVVSGWYMDKDDVMHDRIVLDRQTAWDLFYSDNVAGMYVTLNGVRYQVAAVVETESGKYNEMAAGAASRAWVFADSPAVKDTVTGFTCIEMVLPQPVENFAATTLKTALGGFIPDKTTVTDNSGRFSLKSRWQILRTIGTRGISSEAIAYPYWENAARLTENRLALGLIPEMILLLFPCVSLVILLLWLNSRRRWGLHSIRDAVENAVDRKYQRDYEARQRGENPKRNRKKRSRWSVRKGRSDKL